ncbi:MAG TPA: response regulator [Gemmatimonadaceae bacterium]|nr:response regulator [Gemmatimonadaceae bacterium]
MDDDDSFRRAVARLIGLWGYRTYTFGSVEEYLQRDDDPDCIVLDVHLEGMSGLELQATLAGRRKTIPIIFVTAQDDPVTRQRALDAGAVAYLEKPFEDYRLLEALQSVTDYPKV